MIGLPTKLVTIAGAPWQVATINQAARLGRDPVHIRKSKSPTYLELEGPESHLECESITNQNQIHLQNGPIRSLMLHSAIFQN